MQIKHFSHGENLAHTSSSQLSVTCPTIFIYTICSSAHQCIIMVDRRYLWWLRTWTMKNPKFCQFTHLSMSPNHCWPSAKLLKLAVKFGHNNTTYFVGISEQKILLYECALPVFSWSLTKGYCPLSFFPSSKGSWH